MSGPGLSPQEARRAGLLKTGDAARHLGTTARTLLFYEEQGLLRPRRTERGTRMYSPSDLARAEIAIRLSHLGFPIRMVKQLADGRPTSATGQESSRKLIPILDGVRREIRTRIAELQEIAEDLDRAEALVRQCSSCTRRPKRSTCPGCPSELNRDQSRLLRLILDPES